MRGVPDRAGCVINVRKPMKYPGESRKFQSSSLVFAFSVLFVATHLFLKLQWVNDLQAKPESIQSN